MCVCVCADDLHSLLYSCMARQDVDSCFFVLQKISELGEIDEVMCRNFIRAARKKGVPLPDIVSKLQSINSYRVSYVHLMCFTPCAAMILVYLVLL